ncbi:MAG: DUF3108 domain-containing protein [Candidatus Krumholzibacteriia bacterium]
MNGWQRGSGPFAATLALTALLAVGVGAAAAQEAVPAPADLDSVPAAGPAAVAAPDSAAAVPFAPGERLVFSIDYGPVNAGEGTLEVRGLVMTDGHPCYLIESRAASNRFFSTFYMVRDRVVSHIDVVHLYSRYFAKRLREGDYRQNIEVRFDQEAGKAHYADGRTFDTMPGIHDVLSAFYYVRTLALEPGRTYHVETHSSRKNYPLEVIVHGRERVKVPAGEFDCLVVEPVIIGDGLFQHEGRLTIWLTDDARRMPVLMKTRVKVGSIDASLKEYVLGQPLP